MTSWVRTTTVLVWMMALSTYGKGPAAQISGTKNQIPQPPDPMSPMGIEAPASVREKQEKLRNDDRQKRLVADTDKLLELATALHQDVGKTNKNILSVDVIKRADEIEKLAHAVKERMRAQN